MLDLCNNCSKNLDSLYYPVLNQTTKEWDLETERPKDWPKHRDKYCLECVNLFYAVSDSGKNLRLGYPIIVTPSRVEEVVKYLEENGYGNDLVIVKQEDVEAATKVANYMIQYQNLVARIHEFATFEDDWDGYDCEPIPPEIIAKSLYYLDLIYTNNLTLPDHPIPSDDVCFAWRRGDLYGDISFFKENTYALTDNGLERDGTNGIRVWEVEYNNNSLLEVTRHLLEYVGATNETRIEANE